MKIYHDYTDTIICPYCGYNFHNSCVYDDWDGDLMRCSSCDKHILLFVEKTVAYSTQKAPCANNEGEHIWERWMDSHTVGKQYRYCRICDETEYQDVAEEQK